MRLSDFDAGAFLRDHWQRKPLLVRNPWDEWRNPLEPDELAGLACEYHVESRLILRKGERWSAEHGPLPASRFGRLKSAPWTLMVQAVDHHVADVAALIAPFRFIPNWRIDDVMVSYAVDGGGVGPHFDQYDVFLIQGLGRRHWQVGAPCDAATPLLPHDDLRLLDSFEPTAEWVLEPGDILYLPPRIAHNGVAIGDDCMTYSIGFRAPSRRELIAAWCDEVMAGLDDDDRYSDPGLAAQDNPGAISADAIARLQALVADKLLDRNSFVRAVGRHLSTPRYPEMDWATDEPIDVENLRDMAGAGEILCRNPASRFSFAAAEPGTVLLFVDGQCFTCRDDAVVLAETLCAQERFVIDAQASTPVLELVCALINRGSIAFTDED